MLSSNLVPVRLSGISVGLMLSSTLFYSPLPCNFLLLLLGSNFALVFGLGLITSLLPCLSFSDDCRLLLRLCLTISLFLSYLLSGSRKSSLFYAFCLANRTRLTRSHPLAPLIPRFSVCEAPAGAHGFSPGLFLRFRLRLTISLGLRLSLFLRFRLRLTISLGLHLSLFLRFRLRRRGLCHGGSLSSRLLLGHR